MHTNDGKSGPGSLYGTLEVMILRTLRSAGPLHGLEIAKEIKQTSDNVLQIEEGALYPALHRMEKRGHLRSEWRRTEHGRRARYYHLTPQGLKELEHQMSRWRGSAWAVREVLTAKS